MIIAFSWNSLVFSFARFALSNDCFVGKFVRQKHSTFTEIIVFVVVIVVVAGKTNVGRILCLRQSCRLANFGLSPLPHSACFRMYRFGTSRFPPDFRFSPIFCRFSRPRRRAQVVSHSITTSTAVDGLARLLDRIEKWRFFNRLQCSAGSRIEIHTLTNLLDKTIHVLHVRPRAFVRRFFFLSVLRL